jgi:hypothetical protein
LIFKIFANSREGAYDLLLEVTPLEKNVPVLVHERLLVISSAEIKNANFFVKNGGQEAIEMDLQEGVVLNVSRWVRRRRERLEEGGEGGREGGGK